MTAAPVPALDPIVRDLVAEAIQPRRSWLARLPLYFHTVRHLRLRQIVWQLKRRLFPPRPPFAAPAASLRAGVRCKQFLRPTEPGTTLGQIQFVGEPRPFPALPSSGSEPDWLARDASKLWRYNLHYFDFLGWSAFSAQAKAELINSWIARVPVGAQDAWEPYPISLRVVNWLKCGLMSSTGAVASVWLASLAHQVAALERDLEYHLLANHLLKNGKALVFAGIYCEGNAAQRWLARGLEIVLAEAKEQVLPDGGHVERSPMYHCIALEDYLDLVNLLDSNPELVASEARVTLRDVARRATAFLHGIRNGTDDIPLFNDAAFAITPPANAVLAYASRVLGSDMPESGRTDDATRIDLPWTGYFGYRHGDDSLIVDCGPVGPDYQPGHAHCDTLSYELHVGGVPIVVDSGTFDYEPGQFRHYLRSTAAHNTVRIDGEEQSEIWGQFRVARRARPVEARLSDWVGGRLVFSGEHDGYLRLSGMARHRREICIESRIQSRGRWEFRDTVTGAGQHRVESFLHFHPALRCEQVSEREFRLAAPSGVLLRLTVGPVGEVRWATAYYCPKFGTRLPNTALVLEHVGSLPAELTYMLERL